jgi:hypothetical protein
MFRSWHLPIGQASDKERTAMLRLIVIHRCEEQVFAVPEGEASLGSASGNDIALRIPGVSRRHAVVRRYAGGVEFIDLRSKNRLFVEGRKLDRAVLTPGLRVQIGEAWLELEEVPSSEEPLARAVQDSYAGDRRLAPSTATADAQKDPTDLSPHAAALALLSRVAEAGAGLPGERADLLARIVAALGAEALMTFERRRRGRLYVLEIEGEFLPRERDLIASVAGEARSSFSGQVTVKQVGCLMLAGRGSWFLAANFAEESLARERWQRDLLRVLAYRLFLPVRTLDEFSASEARRVLALVGGTKVRAAKLLGICRTTLDKLLLDRRRSKR